MNERENLRVVIVDDEPLARSVIREYLSKYPEIEVAATASTP